MRSGNGNNNNNNKTSFLQTKYKLAVILIVLYRVFEGFELKLGKRSEMVIFESFLTTFVASTCFEASGAVAKIGFSPYRTNCHSHVKLVQIPDTHCSILEKFV